MAVTAHDHSALGHDGTAPEVDLVGEYCAHGQEMSLMPSVEAPSLGAQDALESRVCHVDSSGLSLLGDPRQVVERVGLVHLAEVPALVDRRTPWRLSQTTRDGQLQAAFALGSFHQAPDARDDPVNLRAVVQHHLDGLIVHSRSAEPCCRIEHVGHAPENAQVQTVRVAEIVTGASLAL
jgi:hypothetical protein